MPFLIINPEPPAFISGFGRRKKFQVDSTVDTTYVIPLRIYNTSGTDTNDAIYLAGNVRSNWQDIRFTKYNGSDIIPFCILYQEATFIDVAIRVKVYNGDNFFYLYYDGPDSDIFKIAFTSDTHYDTGTDLADRDNALIYIANFVTRMQTYLPDLAISAGDKVGASSSVEATQLGWYQAVLDAFDNVAPYATDYKMSISPGNHDFDVMTFANVLAKHGAETWMESGKLYGKWETTDYCFISIDANYSVGSQTHLNVQHNGYGYVNTDQLAWLKTTLADSTKPCVVFIHQGCAEMDTDQFNLTQDVYHTRNRQDVRNILEASGKVIAVIHGHLHYHRVDVINGIPYIECGNTTNDGMNNTGNEYGEVPYDSNGRWELIELDSVTKTITAKREIYKDGDYETIYESVCSFGPTSLFEDVHNNYEAVFKFEGSPWKRSAILRDPTQLFVNNDDYMYKFPRNLYTPDPYLSDKTIRINGRTNSPNFGKAYWYFEAGTLFSFKFAFQSATLATKEFKLGDSDVATAHCCRIVFNSSGDVIGYDGATPTTLQAYVINTWYEIEMIVDVTNDTYTIKIDGSTVGSGFDFVNAKGFIRVMEIVTETGDCFIDNMRAEPYLASPPAITDTFSEETP